ncbi:MAG: pitrilysin family protein [Candidatus Aminicenantes bacterium]|nr:pitrilysin family protein [Candidatus Aminicenantes bacterium]
MAFLLAWPNTAPAAAAPAGNGQNPSSSYFVLDNGLQVLLQEKHDLPLTAMTLAVNLGVKDETENSSGYTHLLEHMLLFGSSAEAGNDTSLAEFRSHGIAANAHTDHDLMTFEVSCPAADSAWALAGLRQTVFSNRMDAVRLEKEKRIILEEILQLRDNPQYLGRLLLMQLLFAGHPYGRAPYGDKNVISKASVEDLQAFGRRFLLPGRCALSIIGDFVLPDMEKQVRAGWSVLEKGDAIAADIPPAGRLKKNVEQRVELDLNESHLFLGWWAPDFNHEHRLALSLLTYVLGRGLNPLLYAVLGGERRLVEQLDMSYIPMAYGGMVVLHLILDEKNISGARNELARFLSQAGSFNFSKEDYQTPYQSHVFDYLESAKNQMTYDAGNFTESALNLSNASARFLLLNLKPSEGSYLENVEKVESSDLRRVAGKYLSGKKVAALAIVPLKKGPQ